MTVVRRVVTLVPAATEIVAALGAGSSLVGVSHECDYPEWVTTLPRLTATPVDPNATAARIDEEVRRLRAENRPVIGVDGEALRRLGPDLILTQGLCEVCAVAHGEVHRLAALFDPAPDIISLTATTLSGIQSDIRRIAEALGLIGSAGRLIESLNQRLTRLSTGAPTPPGPRVVCIEWLEPLYLAGHWVPELVAAAGGRDVGARAGDHSTVRSWGDVTALEPDILLVMLCGLGVERATRDLNAVSDAAATNLLDRVPVWVLDGNAYTSRPGPRVVDGAERIQAALQGREMSGLRRWHPAQQAA